MLNHLKFAGLLLCISIPLMFYALNVSVQQTHAVSRGNYFFENTRKNTSARSIILKFADNQTISFVQKGNFWYIKEADDYYASFAKINTLIKLLRDTVIYRADLSDKNEISKYTDGGLSIQIKNENGDIIDDALILPKKENNLLHYALLNHDNFLYQITQDFDLSPHLMDWVQMPLLAIAYNQIKFLKTDNFGVYRSYANEPLKSISNDIEVPHIHNLVNSFWYLSASEVKHAVHFNQDVYKHIKSYEISTMNGLIYTINIFYGDNEYWLNIKLGHGQIITADSMRLLEENVMLYDGWFFKINNNLAEAIVHFTL